MLTPGPGQSGVAGELTPSWPLSCSTAKNVTVVQLDFPRYISYTEGHLVSHLHRQSKDTVCGTVRASQSGVAIGGENAESGLY